jgi:hypothetical protein
MYSLNLNGMHNNLVSSSIFLLGFFFFFCLFFFFFFFDYFIVVRFSLFSRSFSRSHSQSLLLLLLLSLFMFSFCFRFDFFNCDHFLFYKLLNYCDHFLFYKPYFILDSTLPTNGVASHELPTDKTVSPQLSFISPLLLHLLHFFQFLLPL